MLYISAKGSALLLVFLHPHIKSEEEDRLKYPVTNWVVASSAMPPLLVQCSLMAFRWRMWHIFALVCSLFRIQLEIKIQLESNTSCCHWGFLQH